MKLLHTTTALAAAITLAACAKHTNEIAPQYTSPMQYGSYSCKQLEREMRTVTRRVNEVGGKVESDASSDDMEMGVGLVLFWPTLFFLDGDTPQANEYARLSGEFQAIEEAANQKNCSFHIERPQVRPPETKTNEPAYPDGAQRR